MTILPENWKLVEEYDGNLIFEDNEEEFQVSIDDMEGFVPRYSINFNQLKGTFTKIGFESGAYSTHAFNKTEAKQKAVDMMKFINTKKVCTK